MHKFSTIINKNTDILVIVVRYFDTDKEDVVDVLLDTVAIENRSAHNPYNAAKQAFI